MNTITVPLTPYLEEQLAKIAAHYHDTPEQAAFLVLSRGAKATINAIVDEPSAVAVADPKVL